MIKLTENYMTINELSKDFLDNAAAKAYAKSNRYANQAAHALTDGNGWSRTHPKTLLHKAAVKSAQAQKFASYTNGMPARKLVDSRHKYWNY